MGAAVIGIIKSIPAAVWRARTAILTVAAAYFLALLAGIVMVHLGNGFALAYRDRLVGDSGQTATAQAAGQGDALRAALLDFSGNLLRGAAPQTLMGLGIVFPYPFVAYQGWVGGIVSMRGDHTSRFDDPRSAVYYLLTLILQLTGYSLAVGAGVNAGISMFRPIPFYQGEKWLKIFPKEAILDIGRIYLLAVPFFLVGSLWEFLSTWNI
jgi:hypothetical protein